MVALSLKICVRHCNVVKTMQFEPSTAVYDACRVIRERVPEAQTGQASDYGLFLSDEDPRKGIWLEAGRTLDYYMLRNGVCFFPFLFSWGPLSLGFLMRANIAGFGGEEKIYHLF
uniref:Talin 2 n=1 Tax=Monodelphis domestica TaxID=13616 RepID=A0A5F8GKY7_MONDO